ncbi:MAG: hypothetical protein M1819_005292 [Sarea resinae]|nr:MAG: hypothetical protein M1819_005292 [Sarea resinae]
MARGTLTGQSLGHGYGFNWVFLVELIVSGILSLFFLFYFNRLFATIVSYGIRAYTWHKHRIYIDIQALQISLLAGRVFFKGLRYHGENETIFIQGGYITWQYWLRRVRKAGCYEQGRGVNGRPPSPDEKYGKTADTGSPQSATGGEPAGCKGRYDLPCRLVLVMQGFEWFVYNRSPAYDAIVSSMSRDGKHDMSSDGGYRAEGNSVNVSAPSHPGEPKPGQVNSYASSSDSQPSSLSSNANPDGSPVNEKVPFSALGEEARPSSNSTRPPSTADGSGSMANAPASGLKKAARKSEPASVSRLLQILPIHIDCSKGAIVMGNENTTSVMTAKFDKANGSIDALCSRPVDHHKQLINFRFTHPVIQMKPNLDYKEPQLASASRMKNPDATDLPFHSTKQHHHWSYRHHKRKLWHSLRGLLPFFQRSVESFSPSLRESKGNSAAPPHGFAGEGQWLGLTRYLDNDQQEEQDRWNTIEYAKFSTVADCPAISLSFYWDVAGLVPISTQGHGPMFPGTSDDINGDAPPDWGIDITVHGGVIHYGPWADRQRANMQAVFFPSLYKDASPAKKLAPGQSRVSTVFKLFIDLEEQTFLRIPTRESSKDWKWKGRSESVAGPRLRKTPNGKVKGKGKGRKKSHKGKNVDPSTTGPDVRPFGWLDLKVMPNSTVSYVMDMIAGADGFKNHLDLDLRGTELSSSVNHGLLWRTEHQKLACDLSNPLKWNGLHTWTFDVETVGLELYLLRDHFFLLTDLINDWGSGSLPDYYTFAPFQYLLNLRLPDFKLYLNANDANIINNPSDPDDNTFVIFHGDSLDANVVISLETFLPEKNAVKFNADARNCDLLLETPPWNTHNTFLDSRRMATLGGLTVGGSYNYFTSTSPSLTDTVLLDVHGISPSIGLHGFLIRHLMKVKENYFGEDLHFRTLEEYQDLIANKDTKSDAAQNQSQPPSKSNDLDVILTIATDNGSLILPSNLYSAQEHIQIDVTSVSADLRFTNYYMDLMVSFTPLSIAVGSTIAGAATPVDSSSSTQIFIDGIQIAGHRLFGLPPTEPTYVCNWDFDVGALTGECSTEFMQHLACGLRAFVFSLDDYENALPVHHTQLLHDITFLRIRMKPVRLWLHVKQAAFLLETDAIKLDFNDWAGDHFSERLVLLIPNLTLACVDGESAARYRSRAHSSVLTHAYLQTTVSFTMVERKLGFSSEKDKQQRHIRFHDSRTKRTEFLQRGEILDEDFELPSKLEIPAMPVPPMPEPITDPHMQATERSDLFARASNLPYVATDRMDSLHSLAPSSPNSDDSVLRPMYGRSPSSHSRKGPTHNYSERGQKSNVRQWDRRARGLREPSVSSGRRSSVYTMQDETDKLRNEFSAPSVAFSSSFAAPYFPLDGIEPDLRDVPVLPDTDGWAPNATDGPSPFNDVSTLNFAEDTVHTSFMINLSHGLRAYCDPQALHAVANLLEDFQPKTPLDLLDDFQIDVMGKISNLMKRKSMNGNTMDVNLRIPYTHIRFVNPFSYEGKSHGTREHDQYNCTLSRFSITARSRLRSQDHEDGEDSNTFSALHVVLEAMSLSASERADSTLDDHAAIQTNLDDLVMWAVSEQVFSVHVQFRCLETATTSRQVEYLASLIHRTAIVSEEVQKTFSAVSAQQQKRLRRFAFALTHWGEGVPNPTFLTRPSYVLRAASDHLRVNDSWKIISRFRYIYQSLTEGQKEDFIRRCYSNSISCPEDAESLVVSSVDQWRSWDLAAHVKQSYAMRKLYGSLAGIDELHYSKPMPVKVAVKTASIRLVIDPGPKQSELAVESLSVTVAVNVPKEDFYGSVSDIFEDTEDTIVQIYCTRVSLRLDWMLCELLDDICGLYNRNAGVRSDTEPDDLPDSALSSTAQSSSQQYHIIFATDSGTIVLDTIHLRSISATKGLKGSVIGSTNDRDGNGGTTVNVLLHSDAASSEIISHSRVLSLSQLLRPSLIISYDRQLDDGASVNAWNLAGDCQKLSIEIKEEVLGLIEVVDLVVGDELSYLLSLSKRLSLDRPSNPGKDTPSPDSTNRIDLALFLDSYEIRVALLQSLSYNLKGQIARLSVAPKGRQDLTLEVDYDLKEHSHDIQSTVGAKLQSISVLKMPPINGHVKSQISDKETVLEMSTIVESIDFDAAAIHGLLNALERPEISSIIEDVREGTKAITAHLRETFRPAQPVKSPVPAKPSKAFFYDARITVAGLNVYANAPENLPGIGSAHLDFDFGSVQLKAANRLEAQGPMLEFPEVVVSLRQIAFELTRLEDGKMRSCGSLEFGATIDCTSKVSEAGVTLRAIHIRSDGLEINVFAETASTIVDVAGHLQNRIKDLDLSKEAKYLKRLRNPIPETAVIGTDTDQTENSTDSSVLLDSLLSLEILDVQASWIVGSSIKRLPNQESEDLVLSIKKIDLTTGRENGARLMVQDLQLQMVPESGNKKSRSMNSALLPEVVFRVAHHSTKNDRRLAFHAAGKSLDLRLTSQFVMPASNLQQSIVTASQKFYAASATWRATPATLGERNTILGNKKLASLLVDADFAGAVVYIQGRRVSEPQGKSLGVLRYGRAPQHGRYGQFTHEDASSTTLRAPGIAVKVEYKDLGGLAPSVNAEIKIDASSNVIYPTVVPLILEISSSVKETVNKPEEATAGASSQPQDSNPPTENTSLTADPSALLRKVRLNLGLRICKQEFSLSCQPHARVAATARFEKIYLTVNTIQSNEQGHLFALTATFNRLQASVQHVYSRESTASIDVDSIVLSAMNSKHVSGTRGISAIVKVGTTKTQINAKQLQDFLLFREIWVPAEIRQSAPETTATPASESQFYLVQRYQQVAAASSFPWNATVAVEQLELQVDLGQSLGKSSFAISQFWACSNKTSVWEQSLCVRFDSIGVNSSGRMSGFVQLSDVRVRTSIRWPLKGRVDHQTPLIQASLGFRQARVKAAFDYQSFLVADITSFEFLMYNVRDGRRPSGDRLVTLLEGDKVQVFCTSTSASQGLALYQAFLRLAQDQKAAYESSLRDIEKFKRRKSSVAPFLARSQVTPIQKSDDSNSKAPLSLHTDVVVSIKVVNLGAFPTAFSDSQIFKMEALDAQARFAVTVENDRVHSGLGLTLGQLRIALAGIRRPNSPATGEVIVEDVVESVTGSRGGTILRVPKVVASMQTWQAPESNHIDYIFRSSFEGKVDVGWNYSRISFIRGMWGAHSRSLALRLGKPLPQAAVQITGAPEPQRDGEERRPSVGEQEKITAVVNLPLSKYEYTALEPPIIETPQLRDMGEATPPLEWIGLHRDRLPNLTHQIVIVTLLEVAKEVEDAYSKILGSS